MGLSEVRKEAESMDGVGCNSKLHVTRQSRILNTLSILNEAETVGIGSSSIIIRILGGNWISFVLCTYR